MAGRRVTPLARKPASTRWVQAAFFLLGAAALEVLVEQGRLRFFWTPLIIGLAYLAAALAGGKRGGHWPTACALLGWGAAVAWVGHTRPQDIDTAGAYLAGGGAGVLLAGLLARAGFALDVVGLGGAVLGAGLVLALSPRVSALGEAQTYALALLAVAAANVLLGLAARKRRSG